MIVQTPTLIMQTYRKVCTFIKGKIYHNERDFIIAPPSPPKVIQLFIYTYTQNKIFYRGAVPGENWKNFLAGPYPPCV